jgi:hypothetical protein
MTDQCSLFEWGSPIERERRIRIRLSLLAYAYEFAGVSLVSDARYDALAKASDPTIRTGYLDDWWRDNFLPWSGMWVHEHPEVAKLERLFERVEDQVLALRPATAPGLL